MWNSVTRKSSHCSMINYSMWSGSGGASLNGTRATGCWTNTITVYMYGMKGRKLFHVLIKISFEKKYKIP